MTQLSLICIKHSLSEQIPERKTMSLWNDYLAKKLIFESHPSLDEKRCLNRMLTRHPCTSCMDSCPDDVFSMPFPGCPETDWEACSACGICVSACPSRAISPARIQAEKLFGYASHIQYDTTVSCKNGYASDLFLEYPGALSWEYLCFLALHGRLTLVTDDCAQCTKTACRKSLEKNLAQAKIFLGEELYSKSVILTQDPDAVPARSITRREAFSLLMKRTGQTASVLLPVPRDSVPDGTLGRQLLLYKVKQLNTVFRWTLPRFTDSCTACSICTRMCPAGALMRVPGPEGSNRFYMALLPHKCTGCGLCSQVCPQSGLTEPSPVSLEAADRPVLHAVAAKPCSRCKEPVPVDSGSDLCDRCRAEMSM